VVDQAGRQRLLAEERRAVDELATCSGAISRLAAMSPTICAINESRSQPIISR